ncbi:hypothetical protein E4U42_004169 [Claviceps africana]|uniref:Uncharacterized protein n=1 Tax=Claviceps africana TaxID=83212 RepID=A0A8K0JBR3_9HYPO|nr:hypothetical protein E4U42_004169 [Claviceps africana]
MDTCHDQRLPPRSPSFGTMKTGKGVDVNLDKTPHLTISLPRWVSHLGSTQNKPQNPIASARLHSGTSWPGPTHHGGNAQESFGTERACVSKTLSRAWLLLGSTSRTTTG